MGRAGESFQLCRPDWSVKYVHQALPQNFSAIQTSRQALGSGDGQNLKLSVLLSRHRSSLATNPSDKVFALFGLSPQIPSKAIDIPVNYEVPLSDLYKSLTIKIIQCDGNLDILSATSLSRLTAKAASLYLPSWVPDWSLGKPWSSIRYNGLETLEECSFHASGNDTPYNLQLENDKILVVRGQIIDKIAEVGAVYSSYEHTKMQSIFSYFPLSATNSVFLATGRP